MKITERIDKYLNESGKVYVTIYDDTKLMGKSFFTIAIIDYDTAKTLKREGEFLDKDEAKKAAQDWAAKNDKKILRVDVV